MKNKKIPIKFQIVIYLFIIGCILIGGFLGVYLIGKQTGEYPYELAYPIIGGTLLGIVIYLLASKWNKKRNGNIPEFDERTVILMQRYLMIVLYVVLVGSAAALLILLSMGIHYVETGMLAVYMMCLFFLIGAGAFITKRL